MSSFNQNINERGQFIITVKIFPTPETETEYHNAAQNANDYHALVDTGASHCCISEKIVNDLQLKSHGQRKIMTAGGPHESNLYLAGLAVSVTETEMRPEEQQDGSSIIKPFPVSEMARGAPQIEVTTFHDMGADRSFDMILGMDMLTDFHIPCFMKILLFLFDER